MTSSLTRERQQYLEEGEQLSREMKDLMGRSLNLSRLQTLLASGTEQEVKNELLRLRLYKDEQIKRWWDNDSSFKLSDIFKFLLFWTRQF